MLKQWSALLNIKLQVNYRRNIVEVAVHCTVTPEFLIMVVKGAMFSHLSDCQQDYAKTIQEIVIELGGRIEDELRKIH